MRLRAWSGCVPFMPARAADARRSGAARRHGKPQVVEFHVLLEQRMRADSNPRLAAATAASAAASPACAGCRPASPRARRARPSIRRTCGNAARRESPSAPDSHLIAVLHALHAARAATTVLPLPHRPAAAAAWGKAARSRARFPPARGAEQREREGRPASSSRVSRCCGRNAGAPADLRRGSAAAWRVLGKELVELHALPRRMAARRERLADDLRRRLVQEQHGIAEAQQIPCPEHGVGQGVLERVVGERAPMSRRNSSWPRPAVVGRPASAPGPRARVS